MTLPRDLSGERLAALLGRYGYRVTRQTGSHMRLTSVAQGRQHHVTIPRHRSLRVGTLSAIVSEVAAYLERPLRDIQNELFD
ncbi:MAG TPA: type II toxin-antitoxin system HicA family toxin [Candidatus Obscuribacterales bacterium]